MDSIEILWSKINEEDAFRVKLLEQMDTEMEEGAGTRREALIRAANKLGYEIGNDDFELSGQGTGNHPVSDEGMRHVTGGKEMLNEIMMKLRVK